MKDSTFYDAESQTYSAKRYPRWARTFTQFFFKERLRITLKLLQDLLPHGRSVSFLEVGCADGVVARAIWERFSPIISCFDAIDMAPHMIEAAKAQHADTPIVFSVRQAGALLGAHEYIIEIGVLNYTDLASELAAVSAALAPGGLYIISLSGTSSLQTMLKGAESFMHAYSYKRYELELSKYFTIVKRVPVGFFIPWLWKLPPFARMMQPLFERIGGLCAPDLAHEKIYVLMPKQ